MHRILALFEERETRDELGLGAIRDSLSDQFFPGTSTIQTRLRYFFFVPWIYQRLEEQRVPSHEIARRGRELEVRLTRPLLEAGETSGVFGRMAGGSLKRLPSEVYWAGLGIWGIRRFDGTPLQYHQLLDTIYRRRSTRTRKDDGEIERDDIAITWHPQLPRPPAGFPEQLDFRLTEEEGEFIKDCLAKHHPHSLLRDLAAHPPGKHVTVSRTGFPWQHPRFGEFSDANRELLHHARLFSDALYGAAILYNYLLAEAADRSQLVDEYREEFTRWATTEVDRSETDRWPLDRFWFLVEGHGYTVTYSTRRFVEGWTQMINEAPKPADLLDLSQASNLIRKRERQLKHARSRFVNKRALDRWGGKSGLIPMSYRWGNVQTLLEDLHAGS